MVVMAAVVLVVALVALAAFSSSLLTPPSDTSNDDSSSNSTNTSTSTYGMSVLRVEKNEVSYSTQPKYDIQLRIWNNGTAPLSLSLIDFDSLGSDGVHYSANYATGKIWSSTSITPGHYTDLWISVTPNGDATIRNVSYYVTQSASFSCTVNQAIIDNTNNDSNGNSDSNTGGDTSSNYGMTVLQMHKIAIDYTGICQLEMQVKIWNNGTTSLPVASWDFYAKTSLGAESKATYLTRDSWIDFTLSPGATSTVWLKVEPGCGVGIIHLSYKAGGITFGCSIDQSMLARATNPWSMSILSVDYVHYSGENANLRMCRMQVQLVNNDYTLLHMNLDAFTGYGIDTVRYGAQFADVDYSWVPFDVAPGRSTIVGVMFEVGYDVQIEHLVYDFNGKSAIECEVP